MKLSFFLSLVFFGSAVAGPTGGRIVGGHDTDIRQVPYQIAIFDGGIRCGGSILNEWTVLTAAHCVGGSAFQVRAGATLYHEGGSLHNVAEVRVHPQNSYPNFDIAIIKLSDPLVFGDTIQPIGVARQEPGEGTPALASGWGQTSDPGSQPEVLQSVTIPIASRQVCRDTYGVGDSVLCATTNGQGICFGDSGGPLVVNGQLVGASSFVNYDGCAAARGPSGFGNIAYMSDWIIQNM